LEVRRQKVAQQLEQVNRQITATEKRLVQIQAGLVAPNPRRPKVA
jgi:hypothetical protein